MAVGHLTRAIYLWWELLPWLAPVMPYKERLESEKKKPHLINEETTEPFPIGEKYIFLAGAREVAFSRFLVENKLSRKDFVVFVWEKD